MKLLSINLGQPRSDGRKKAKTGIYKEPAGAPVEVGFLGLQGDAVCDRQHHGGPDQAVYLYDALDYTWWSKELGREMGAGMFGDNLTTAGLDVQSLAIGDRLEIGPVELEVTSPRIPCGTLARRMEDEGFVKRFLEAARPGAYLRVLQPGLLSAGETVRLQPFAGERVGLIEMYRDFHHPLLTVAALRRILAAPIAERTRAQKEEQLARVLAALSR